MAKVSFVTREETIDRIRDVLLPVFEAHPIYTATIFGSYARGNATEQSDVDIVIDSYGQLLNMDFYGVLDEITERLGKPVVLFEWSEIRKPSPLHTMILQEGVSIYDRKHDRSRQ